MNFAKHYENTCQTINNALIQHIPALSKEVDDKDGMKNVLNI
jgi:hypothetical protein